MGKVGYSADEKKRMKQAMRLSLCIGFFMLILKTYAYAITGSAAILSDAAESIVHILAVGFAAFSLWLSFKPADKNHTYGHDRIAFFSAGFEGGLIFLAALFIIYESIKKLIYGIELQNLDTGMLYISIATFLNGFLGYYLIRKGKKYHSLVLEADGKHILTDCMTSLGVIVALVLTMTTRWYYFDPIIGLLIGFNILWTGTKLIKNSVKGLMDQVDFSLDAKIHLLLSQETQAQGISYHHLRHRNAGNRLLIEVHLLFPQNLSLVKAHEIATMIEDRLEKGFSFPAEVVTHLEPLEGHDEIHAKLLGREG